MDAAPPTGLPDGYDITTGSITVGGELFTLNMVRDTGALVDGIDPAVFAVDERFPYWAELWASSLALADKLGRMELKHLSVLELGCGLGLSGIVAARHGARVTMTDYEPDALAFAAVNASANLTHEERSRLVIRMLDWRRPDLQATFDLIIGADIVYERRNFSPLLALFQRAVPAEGMVVLADPDRALGAEFVSAARADRWAVTTERTIVQFKERPVTIALHTLAPHERRATGV